MANEYMTQLKILNNNQSRKRFQNIIVKMQVPDLKYAWNVQTKICERHTAEVV